MQATTTPDSPTTNDPNKKKTNVKRAKASVACQECRKRKVKCEGIQPCERCRKSSLTCVFPQQQNAKRNQPKQYIEILETRLKNMERTLLFMGGTSIQNMIDGTLHLDPHSIQDRNGIHEDDTTIQQPNEFHASSIHRLQDQYTMNEIGQPYYTQDIYRHIQQQQQQYYPSNRPMTLHRQPSDMSLPTNNDTGIHSEPTTPTPSPHHHHHQQHQHLLSKSEYDLIEIYFEYIHPYLPMIHTVMFKRQLMDVNEQPPLFLIYAMCALASRWIPSSQQQQQLSSINEPPGFTYYRRAYALIDEAMVAPRVTTIQALILLAKYQEQYKRLGSFYRTDQYLTIATEMCFHLNLMDLPSHHHVDNQDFETKKRTFWVTFLYDLWLSIEKGRKPSFDIKLCKTDYPTADSNEGPDIDDIISRQNMVIRLGKIISEIYEFSRVLAERRQEQGSIRTEEQQIEEQGKLFTLQTYLESYLREITTISRFDYSPSNYIIHQMNHPLQGNNDNTNNSNNNNNNNNTSNNNNTTTNNSNNNNGNSNNNNNNITINGQPTIKYPIDQVPVKDPFVGFLHMMYHYAIILLHLHHTLFPSNKPIITPPYPHQQLCALSASIINGITESILDSNPIDTFYYPIRGVQFTLLCSTMANTVHKFEMKTTQDEQRKNNAEGLYRQILTIIGRLSNETSAMELQFLAKEADLAEMYNKLAVDTNDVKNGGGLYNSNNMNDTPPPPPPPPSSSTHSPNSTITMNNDNSSASSSPILSPSHVSSSTSSVVVDKMHRSMKMVNKSKRNTMPTNGTTSLKRFSSPTFSTDQLYTNYPLPSSQQQQQQQQQSLHHHLSSNNTSLQQQQQQQPMPSSASSVLSGSSATTTTTTSTATPMNPSVLFNSSASITDPSRLEYMMQSGKFPMASFNHHQQPIQIPIHHPSPPQQQSIHNTLKRMPRTQGIPYSQSTDDLRSLNSRHKNRAGYSRIASSSIATGMEDPPIRLKKQRSMKFPPTYSTTTHVPPSSSSSSSSSSTSSTSHIQQHYHSSNIPSQLSMPPTTHSISISSQQQQQPLTHFQTKPMLSLQQHQHQHQQQPIIYHQPFNNNHNTYPLTSQPLSFSSSPSSSPSSSSMNYSMIPSSPTISGIPRRHTISSTGFETSQPPQPIGMIPSNGIPMDYTIQSPLVTMDTTQLEYHPPLSSLQQQQQLSSSSFMTSSSLQQQHHQHHHHHHPNTTSFYTSSMNHNNSANNGGDHLMMESDMHHPFLNDSSLGSNIDMDRKMEGHVLQ